MSLTNLTAPWWLAGLGALAGLLYLLQRLRIRHRAVTVPTLLFWRAAAEAAPARTLVERFRHPWAYALLLLICALLWLAFAEPRPADSADRTLHVAVLDGSAAMGAGSRFADAVAALRRQVRALPRERRQVLWAGAEPLTLLNPGEHELLLDRRLAGLRPEAAPASVAPLLASLAQEASPARPVAVTVFGEAPLPADPAAHRDGLRVSRHAGDRAAPGPNHGVTALGVADARSGRWTEVDVLFSVAGNPAAGAAPTPLVDLDGRAIPAERLPAPAADRADYLLPGLPATGGRLTIRLPGEDALAADNTAQLRLPQRPLIRVQLSPSLENLRAVLAADPAVELVAADGDVVVRREDEAFGAGRPALEFVSRTGHPAFAIVHPDRLDSRTVLREAVDATGLRDVDATALAETAGQVIEVAVAPGPQWRIQLWTDLLSPEFNFTAARPFPLFLANAVRWLARADTPPPYAAAGRPLLLPLAGEGPRLLGADGRALDPLGDAPVPPRAGEFRREGSAPPLAVSLLDLATTTAAGGRAEAGAAPSAASAWPAPLLWLLGLALLLLLLEWYFLQHGRLP